MDTNRSISSADPSHIGIQLAYGHFRSYPHLFSHKDYYYCVYKFTLCINDHFDTLSFIIQYVTNFCFTFHLSIKWWFVFNSLASTFDSIGHFANFPLQYNLKF